MRITRKGNPKGFDIDFQVDDITEPEEVDLLHKSLLKKGLLFTYATGGIPYEPPTQNIILHYIDKEFNLYDYAILFTPQPKKEKVDKPKTSTIPKDPELKERSTTYAKLKGLLYAFRNHLKAYKSFKPKYLSLFKKLLKHIQKITVGVEPPTEYTEESLLKLDKDMREFFAF
jgi:hypothetical protein